MQEHTAGSVLHSSIKDIEVLGFKAKPVWNRDAEGLHIRTAYMADGPITFKITLE